MEDIYKELNTSIQGLTENEVKRRVEINGLNVLNEKKKNIIMEMLYNFQNYFIILLFIVSIFSFFIAHIRNESYFVSMVLLIVSFINLYLKNLKEKHNTKKININNEYIMVIRDGIRKNIKVEELVVGDVVFLEAGSYSLIEGKSINNSDIYIGDYISSSSNYIVTKTGSDTSISNLLNNRKNKMNDVISIVITIISLCMILIVMIVGLFLKYDFFDIVVLSLSLLIAIIPEGLILCTTFHLINSNTILKNNNINIKKLNNIKSLEKINMLVLSDNHLSIIESLNKMEIKYIIVSNNNVNINMNKINEQKLMSLSEEERLKAIDNYQVFENISSKTKQKIISLLKDKGYIIGVIGNNLSDIYMMLEADLSISINNELLNDVSDSIVPNLEFIPKLLGEGKRVNEINKKSCLYLLTGSIIEGLVMFFSIIFNTELLTNIQLLWLNIVVATTLSMLLIFEKKYYYKDNKYLSRIIIKIIFHSIVAIFLFLYYSRLEDILIASSILFIYFIINEFMFIFSFKDIKSSVLNSEIANNKHLLIGVIAIILIQLIILFSKLSGYFIISGIGVNNIIVILGICLVTFVLGELMKPIYRKVFKE